MDRPTKQQVRARACAERIFTKIITLDPKVYESLIDEAGMCIFNVWNEFLEKV